MHGVRFSEFVRAFGSTFGVRCTEWRSVRSIERVYVQFDSISSGTGKICPQHGGVRPGEVSAKGGSTVILVQIPTLTSLTDQQNFNKIFCHKFSWLHQLVETFRCLRLYRATSRVKHLHELVKQYGM